MIHNVKIDLICITHTKLLIINNLITFLEPLKSIFINVVRMSSVLTIKKRKDRINDINDNLTVIPDNILDDVFKIVSNAVNIKKRTKDGAETIRFYKIQFIENNLRYVTDEDIIEIADLIINTEYEESQQGKMERVALEIVNKLLEVKEKPQIDNLCDFKMSRDEILSDECRDVINENKQYIFESGFSKSECKVYQTKIINKHFSLFKGMINQVKGYVLCSKTKIKTQNYERTPYTGYYIDKT